MALSEIKKDFRKVLKKASTRYKGYTQGLGNGTLVVLTLSNSELVDGAIKGTDLVKESLVAQGETDLANSIKATNNSKNWTKLVTEELKAIKSQKAYGSTKIMPYSAQFRKKDVRSGIYFGDPRAGGAGSEKEGITLLIWVFNAAAADAIIDDGNNFIQTELWNSYMDILFPPSQSKQGTMGVGKRQSQLEEAVSRQGKRTTVGSRFGLGFKKQHGVETTTAKMSLENELKNHKWTYKANAKTTTIDIVQFLKDEIEVDWDLVQTKKKFAHFGMTNVLTLSIGKNPDLETDVSQLVKSFTPFVKEELINQGILGIDQKASKTLRDQITEDVVADLVRPLTKSGKPDRRFKVNRKLKNFKGKKRNENLKKSKRHKPKTAKKAIRSKGTASIAKRGKRKPVEKTDIAAELAKQKRYIQRRLPAEVRRNMGRPALINRTGRFSNSVQLLSLTENQQGVFAKYTYLLSPYQTFENTGKKRWPLAYNPKPLIAKSIRNLAQGRIEQKLTVRRV